MKGKRHSARGNRINNYFGDLDEELKSSERFQRSEREARRKPQRRVKMKRFSWSQGDE